MWKVVYIAQTKENAQEIKELLTNNGFLIQMNVCLLYTSDAADE